MKCELVNIPFSNVDRQDLIHKWADTFYFYCLLKVSSVMDCIKNRDNVFLCPWLSALCNSTFLSGAPEDVTVFIYFSQGKIPKNMSCHQLFTIEDQHLAQKYIALYLKCTQRDNDFF